MIALLQAAAQPVNLLYTTLLAMVLIYWLSTIIGIFDVDALDFDFDTDVDLDVDMDAEMDADTEVSGVWIAGALGFFNFGKVPFMVVMSFVVLFQWAIALFLNDKFGDYNILFALATALPILFVSLLLTKGITTPLIPVFSQLNAYEAPVDYIGRLGTITLSPTQTKAGQAEVVNDSNRLIVLVKVLPNKVLPKRNEEVVILEKSEDGSFYWVEKFES